MFVPPRPPDSHRGILCPTCGYDLRGTMGDWSRACPLRGVCSECGLQFEWAEMIGERSGFVGRAADAISDLLGMPRSRVRRFLRRLKYRRPGRASHIERS